MLIKSEQQTEIASLLITTDFRHASNINDIFKRRKKKEYYLRLKKPRMLHSSVDPEDHESNQAMHKWLQKMQEIFLLEVSFPKTKCRRSVYVSIPNFVLNFTLILVLKFLIFKLRKSKALAPVASRASLCGYPVGGCCGPPESREVLAQH